MTVVRRFHVVNDEVGGWVPRRLVKAVRELRRTMAAVAAEAGFSEELVAAWATPGSGQVPSWGEADQIGRVLGIRTEFFFAHPHTVDDDEPLVMAAPVQPAPGLTVVKGSPA